MNLINQLTQNQNPIRQALNNPQNKQQIQEWYKQYKANPQGFVNQAIQNNPQLQNNPMLKLALNGGNVNSMLQGMLSQNGLSVSDITSLFK